ncbi:hypothetical protein N7462_008510 [Penicillium macrosclerotiorum]|uniref:uncharacterized protein n=1 Tax=Penicillium macrosclerotiorum TaxID=303699 RepID=UPI0025465F0A|nr:uncharacterized protein N7462_008510 [Penicillium macrosclerotiorum]KAJ5675613.1 hypothetical protein N7462_008510 [Penicillium macrosclerotiorum]
MFKPLTVEREDEGEVGKELKMRFWGKRGCVLTAAPDGPRAQRWHFEVLVPCYSKWVTVK